MKQRTSGVLLPVFSLPSPYGIGTMGRAAYRWLDFLAEAGQSCWQVLPLGVTGFGNSPYQALSAYAGNPYFLDLERFVEAGYLSRRACGKPGSSCGEIDYAHLWKTRIPLLKQAFRGFCARGSAEDLAAFSEWKKRCVWAEDFARFMVCKDLFGQRPWKDWADWAKFRTGEDWERFIACGAIGARDASEDLAFWVWTQYEFETQWNAVRDYAHARGISVFGDMPIYVAEDSADVWAQPSYFRLEAGRPSSVAGVPPDYFSETGQLWGNPLYTWDYHRAHGYDWWIARLKHALSLYDILRIDHFRGFAAYYAIPYGAEDARSGDWEKGPGRELFDVAERALGKLPVVAEDLGCIDADVRALLDACGYPGMKVLQFAFDGNPDNPYLPAHHIENCVLYLGTHDNTTLADWGRGLSQTQRAGVYAALHASPRENLESLMMKTAAHSVAETVVYCAQDLLRLGGESRINTPGTSEGNWKWKLRRIPSSACAAELKRLTVAARRCARGVPTSES